MKSSNIYLDGKVPGAEPDMADEPKILYIAGVGRSGSTLLERMLGQIGDIASVGELQHIWERGFIKNQLCGCGSPFKECSFWSAVVNDAFGGFDQVNAQEIMSLERSVNRTRHIPFTLLMPKSTIYCKNAEKHVEIISRLYKSIQKVSGKKIILDSSKNIPTLYLLNRFGKLGLYTLHLARDSRAVAFSWCRKRRVRPEIIDRKEYLPVYKPRVIACRWVYVNLGVEFTRAFAGKYKFIRYEDMVQNPSSHISDILKYMGVDERQTGFINGGRVNLDITSHTVSGNPVRFKSGEVNIRPDMEWRKAMRAYDRHLVTMLTSPLLWKYGYTGSRQNGASA